MLILTTDLYEIVSVGLDLSDLNSFVQEERQDVSDNDIVDTNTQLFGDWTLGEQNRFHEAFEIVGNTDWNSIVAHVGSRDFGQVYSFYTVCRKNDKLKAHNFVHKSKPLWTALENEQLRLGVIQYGASTMQAWDRIRDDFLPGRTSGGIRKHYYKYANEINTGSASAATRKDMWSHEEKVLLRRALLAYPADTKKRWETIHKEYLPMKITAKSISIYYWKMKDEIDSIKIGNLAD
jgi:hypothetical protein